MKNSQPQTTHSSIYNVTLKHTNFDIIDSTQLYARTKLNDLQPNEWVLYTANGQTAGIGQQNKTWVSPYGLNVYATYGLLLNEQNIEKIFCIPQVSTLPVLSLLSDYGINANIKWVNDVLINKKKVCGILSESFSNSFEDEEGNYTAILIGIGINVNSDTVHLSQVLQPATSMKIETSKEFDINSIIQSLSQSLIYHINKLICDGFDTLSFKIEEALEKFDNKAIVLKKTNNGVVVYKVGYIKGIGEKGELILTTKTQEEKFFDGRIARGEDLKEALSNSEVVEELKELCGDLSGVINEDYNY